MWKEILNKYNNRWINRYIRLIEYAKSKPIPSGTYTEKHHILPQSRYPEYKDALWNLVVVEARVHLFAHYMLANAFGGREWFSVNLMLNSENPFQQRKMFNFLHSKLFEKYKVEHIENLSITMSELRNNESPAKNRIGCLIGKERYIRNLLK